MIAASSPPAVSRRGSATEVFATFLRLGCMSFGGPVAHLGYFQTEFVERRHWCDQNTFAELVALAQSVPGPASSQVGFALGLLRAGWLGGLAAWVGFTTPSALIMLAFAFGHPLLTGRLGQGIIHGLQLVAVAVVAQAIVVMRKSLAPDMPRIAIAIGAATIAFYAPPAFSSILAISIGALAGRLLPSRTRQEAFHQFDLKMSKSVAATAATMFVTLLVLPPVMAAVGVSQGRASIGVAVFGAFYRTGALVFGGGHVVLPLLENAVVARGWLDEPGFLAGYGAAQALPGPLFTFAAYLGVVIRPTFNPFLLSALATIAIFLPGLLVITAVLPFWSRVREQPQAQAALRGVNAAVVGVLMAAFIRPVWTNAVLGAIDFAIVLLSFILLVRWKIAPWKLVLAIVSLSSVAALLV